LKQTMLPSDQPEFSLEHLAGFVELLQISLEQPLGARQLLRHFPPLAQTIAA
jgi:hypothetical protein